MNKLNALLIWCLLLGALAACGDKKEDPQPVAETASDYLPIAKGNTWTYGGDRPYTNTVTGETKVFEGKTYHEFESKEGNTASKTYIMKEKGVYWGIGFVPIAGNTSIPILKEDTPVNKPWEQSTVINGLNTKVTFNIVEKGITKTVEGKVYKDVIHETMVSSYSLGGIVLTESPVAHYYFAKGVGLIYTEIEGAKPFPLVSYTVK